MHRRLSGLLIGLASALVLSLVSLADPSLFGTEWLYYDAVARLVARRDAPDPRIVIISLNEKSIQSLEPFYGRPPYSREVMALVTDEVRRGGGMLIVFDYQFTEEDRNSPDGDRAFALALSQTPSVLAVNTEEGKGLTPLHDFRSKLWQVEGDGHGRPARKLTPPVPMFSGATAIGTIRMAVQERSAATREYALVDRVEGVHHVPTLALAAAATLGKMPRKARFAEGRFQGEGLTVPVRSNGNFLIHWNGAKKDPLELSYASVNFDHVVLAALSRSAPDAPYTAEQLDSFARQRFEGKIAVVALTTTGAATDLRATPLTPASAGVEIHANALDNLMNGRFNREAPRLPMVLLMLVATLLAGALMHPVRSPVLASLIALLFMAGWLSTGYLAMDRGLVIKTVAPSSAMLVTYIASTAINVITEQRQTMRVKATFGHYVSPQVLKYLLDDPQRVSLGGERRELTILFSDIRGFTSISEASQPEEVVEMLNEYLTRMVNILLEHGGTLDKFIGDAVMGFWNAPTPDPDHARHAVECAIDMIKETAALREKWTRDEKPPIRIGIGINTGEAVVGNIGSRQVFGYTVIGDAVNLASRLEGINKEHGTEIIISEMTRERIGDGIETASLGEVKVKGKEQAVRIYEVKAQ